VGVKNPIYKHQLLPPCLEFMPHGICAQWGVHPMLVWAERVRITLTQKSGHDLI